MTDLAPFHLCHPAITAAQVRAEIDRELAQRRRFYAHRVKEGRMTEEERTHGLAVASAWLSDVERIISHEAASAAAWERFKKDPREPHLIALPPVDHAVSWRDRHAGLTRELTLRRRIYQRRVEEAAMTAEQRDHRIACLEALAARYDDGFDWTASNGERPHWAITFPIPDEIAQARREWEDHRREVEARRTPQSQGEMAL